MKKNGFVDVLVSLVALLVVSCSSSPNVNVFDKSVPFEESSTLIIVGCSVFTFDGTSMRSNKDWQAHNSFPKQIIIPAGTHSLSVYAEYSQGSTLLQVSSDPFSYDFLPGHSYVVRRNSTTSNKGVNVAEATGIFDEFVPNSGGSDASPLEGKWSNGNGKYQLFFSGNQFVTAIDGVYQMRGVFSIDDGTVYMPLLASYTRGKWIIDARNLTMTLTYNGTSLIGGNAGQTVYNKEK